MSDERPRVRGHCRAPGQGRACAGRKRGRGRARHRQQLHGPPEGGGEGDRQGGKPARRRQDHRNRRLRGHALRTGHLPPRCEAGFRRRAPRLRPDPRNRPQGRLPRLRGRRDEDTDRTPGASSRTGLLRVCHRDDRLRQLLQLLHRPEDARTRVFASGGRHRDRGPGPRGSGRQGSDPARTERAPLQGVPGSPSPAFGHRRHRAHPLYLGPSERLHRRAARGLSGLPQGLPPPAPSRTVRLQSDPGGHGPALYARGIPGGGQETEGFRSGIRNHVRRHRRVPDRNRRRI